MTDLEKSAIKDVLHFIVDKEVGTVISELMGKLPGVGGLTALTLWNAAAPIVIKAIDSSIDSI